MRGTRSYLDMHLYELTGWMRHIGLIVLRKRPARVHVLRV